MVLRNHYGPHRKKSTRELLSSSTASQIAEAALVLPLAFMMLLGIYWFGRAFNIYGTINHAVQQGVRTGVAQTCATCGNASVLSAQTPTAITSLMQASHVDPAQIQSYAPAVGFCAGGGSCSTDPNRIRMCSNVLLSPPAAAGPQACGVSVSFQYPYQFWLPFTSLNRQQIVLKVNVQMKGEY
jgi:hypothetical protein